MSIPNNITAQIFVNGPLPCSNNCCQNYVFSYENAIFLVNQGGAAVWCSFDCLIQSMGRFIEAQETNRKIFRVDMLDKLGYKNGKEEGGK
jgi:hypothetical protein